MLEKLIRENPKFVAVPDVFFHLCYLLSREGKEEEIRKLFQKASAIAPPHLLASLVEIYYATLPTSDEKIRLLEEFFNRYPWAKWLKGMGTELTLILLENKKWEQAEELLRVSEAEGIPVQKDWFEYIEALKDASQGSNEKAERLYAKLKSNPDLSETWSFMTIDLLEEMGKIEEARNETRKLLKTFSLKGNELYEERTFLNINRLFALYKYIGLSIRLKDYKGTLRAIKDFLELYNKMVVIGYDRCACYAQTIGGIIYYYEGEKEKAKEWLTNAYHNPYFKELDTKLIGYVKKALKELEKTKP